MPLFCSLWFKCVFNNFFPMKFGCFLLDCKATHSNLLFLFQRGCHQNIENSTMMAFSAIGLFVAAGCMRLLKRWGKQPYQNWHKLWSPMSRLWQTWTRPMDCVFPLIHESSVERNSTCQSFIAMKRWVFFFPSNNRGETKLIRQMWFRKFHYELFLLR